MTSLESKERPMHKTRIDIPEKARGKLTDLLNARLADAIDLQLAAKHAHWNVKGPHFISLHELFDGLAGALAGPIDDIAERITTLGGTADGTVGLVARRTSLDPYPAEIVAGSSHVEALAGAVAAFGRSLRKAMDQAGKLGDDDTADLLTGVSREVDKQLWLLEAHQQSEP
jgi:starvation-inducible DNA-binding protein